MTYLASCCDTWPLKGHVLHAAESDHSVQVGPSPFQPAIGQVAGRTAVDLLALRSEVTKVYSLHVSQFYLPLFISI